MSYLRAISLTHTLDALRAYLEKTSILWILSLGLLLLFAEMLFALSIGSAELSMQTIFDVLCAGISSDLPITAPGQGAFHDIVWILRMPRLLLAACVGAGLAVSGAIMQAIVRNPLADPYIMGVSAGASLGATLAILLGVGMALGSDFIGICAFFGAFAAAVIALILANIGGKANAVKLLLAGVAIGSVCSAFSSFIIYITDDKGGIQRLVFWLMGSFAGAAWEQIPMVAGITLLGIGFFLVEWRILDLMLLGDDTAITLGRDLALYRQVYLAVVALMVGFFVYSCGMIGFVGLIIPHITRFFTGSLHNRLIPVTAIVGAFFTILADLLARVVIPHMELPVGIVISMVGAPCFIYLIIRRTYEFGGKSE